MTTAFMFLVSLVSN